MKFILFFVLAVFVATSSSSGDIVVTVYNSIEEYKTLNPNGRLIEMQAYDHEIDASRSYSVGARQTGDAVVANSSDKKRWPNSQNVTTTLSYPSTGGNGAFLTYILINCEQASNLGRAYITFGGIGQHNVQIIIEAQVTSYFNYAAFFYGIK